MRVAMLGTGIMGAPIARHLAGAGHEVRAWNRTRAKAEPLSAAGVRVVGSPADAVSGADVIVTMLADGGAVEAAMTRGDGGLSAAGAGVLWLQMSTVGVRATARCAALAAERGIDFVDAPVLGSRSQAESGELVVFASGDERLGERSAPAFEPISRRVLWVGDVGAGSKLKLVVNSWVVCSIEGIAETFALSRALGLDPRRFLEAIEGGAMDMQYVHTKGKAILDEEFPPAFPLRLARKDVSLVLEAADGSVELPLVRSALAQFDRALELGHGDEDMAAVYYASARSLRDERDR